MDKLDQPLSNKSLRGRGRGGRGGARGGGRTPGEGRPKETAQSGSTTSNKPATGGSGYKITDAAELEKAKKRAARFQSGPEEKVGSANASVRKC